MTTAPGRLTWGTRLPQPRTASRRFRRTSCALSTRVRVLVLEEPQNGRASCNRPEGLWPRRSWTPTVANGADWRRRLQVRGQRRRRRGSPSQPGFRASLGFPSGPFGRLSGQRIASYLPSGEGPLASQVRPREPPNHRTSGRLVLVPSRGEAVHCLWMTECRSRNPDALWPTDAHSEADRLLSPCNDPDCPTGSGPGAEWITYRLCGVACCPRSGLYRLRPAPEQAPDVSLSPGTRTKSRQRAKCPRRVANRCARQMLVGPGRIFGPCVMSPQPFS